MSAVITPFTRGAGRRGGDDADTRPYLLLGLGASGLACARHLVTRGHAVEVIDTRAEPPGLAALQAMQPTPTVRTGPVDAFIDDDIARRYRAMVVSPGLPLDLPAIVRARSLGLPVIGEIELFARALPANAAVAAITGTNGKSTVTSLVGAMLREAGWPAAAGGNLGPPALELLEANPLPQRYALELSSFQLERCRSLSPRVAALLNLSADHLDHHGSLEAYAAAKARVFRGARIAIVNLDQPELALLARRVAPAASLRGFTVDPRSAASSALTYSLADGCFSRGSTRVAPRDDFAPAGAHNAANALAALAIADALGVPQAASLAALRAFNGLPHRCEAVGQFPVGRGAKVLWLNDSKGTNVGASLAALEGVGAEHRVVLMLGGDGKGQDFTPLAEPIARLARGVVLYGRDRDRIGDALQRADVLPADLKVRRVDTLGVAIGAAGELAEPGDAVLLSPACASFDQFPNYLARGVAFTDAVQRRFGPHRAGGQR